MPKQNWKWTTAALGIVAGLAAASPAAAQDLEEQLVIATTAA